MAAFTGAACVTGAMCAGPRDDAVDGVGHDAREQLGHAAGGTGP